MCFQLAREGTQPQMPCHLVLLRWWFLPKAGNWYHCHYPFCCLHPKQLHVLQQWEVFSFICLGIILQCLLLPPHCTSLSSPSVSEAHGHKLSCTVICIKKRKVIEEGFRFYSFFSPLSKEFLTAR
jgi:hypothetical protein